MHNKNITLSEVFKILGKEVVTLLGLSFLAGVTLFLLEYTFIYSLQLFLVTIGFVDISKVETYEWLPTSQEKVLTLFLAVGVLRSMVMMTKAYLSGAVTQTFLKEQRRTILKYALAHSHDKSSYKITSLFTDKVNRAGAVLRVLSTVLMTITSSVCLLGAGFYLAPYEMLLGLISFAIVLFPMRYLNKRLLLAGDGLTLSWDKTLRYLMEGLKFHKFFKVHSLIQRQTDDGQRNIDLYNKHYKRYFLFAALKNGFPNFIGIFIVVFIVYFSLFNFNTTPSKLIAFLYIFMRLAHALSESNAAINDFRLNYNLLRDYFFWHKENSIRDYSQKRPIDFENQKVNLSLKNITHQFENNKIFNDFSYEINTGDILVIKGESGSGKSTLLHIILGFLKPNNGQVEYNNNSILENDIGPHLAYVGPEPVLFEGTIKENLLFGNTNTSIEDKDLWDALKKVSLDEHINGLPHKLNDNLSENAEFSTGQKQRLCLARAILRDSKIIVLDEATANLDHDTETKIISNISDDLNNKLTIIVSHKPSYDQISTKSLELPVSR